jgi:hypothetical protein
VFLEEVKARTQSDGMRSPALARERGAARAPSAARAVGDGF